MIFNTLFIFLQGNSKIIKEVGSATKDTDMTFSFKLKNPGKKLDINKIPFQVIKLQCKNELINIIKMASMHFFYAYRFIPFIFCMQVQISYTLKDGRKMMRTISKCLSTTDNREAMEEVWF